MFDGNFRLFRATGTFEISSLLSPEDSQHFDRLAHIRVSTFGLIFPDAGVEILSGKLLRCVLINWSKSGFTCESAVM